jgi:hypothetical protein
MGNSWASRMAKASASGGGNFITRHGRYTMVVTECSGKVGTDAGHKGESIAVRLRIVEAHKTGLTVADEGTHEVGDTVSVVFNFTKQPEMAPGKLKALILAITGKKEKEIPDEQMEAIGEMMISAKQPFVGKRVKCETFIFTTKKDVKGVGQNWEFVNQTAESLAEDRAAVLGAP